mgnify:CR=1 FL=1
MNIASNAPTLSILKDMESDSNLRTRLQSPQFRSSAVSMYLKQQYPTYSDVQSKEAFEHIIQALDNAKISPTNSTTNPTPKKPAVLAMEAKEAGNVAFAAHDYSIALDLYKQAITHQHLPILPTLHANVAACALALNQYPIAAAAASSCLAIEPNNIKALYRLALAHQHMGKIQEALTCLTKGIQLDDGLYSDKNKKKLIKVIRKTRDDVLNALEEIPIESYSFQDDGKPKVKVYLFLDNVGELLSDDITIKFERMSMDLLIRGYQGQNLRLNAIELWSSIDVNKCKMKIKPNKIVLTLYKAQNDGMRPWEKLRR